jgi:hypothetical protein
VLFSREIGDMVHTIRLLHKVPSLCCTSQRSDRKPGTC